MAAIKIKFDTTNNPENPTFILATKSGQKLGQINAQNINLRDAMTGAPEITFRVYKKLGNKREILWSNITDFKLVWCKEWDVWFEISVEIEENNSATKIISCTRLGEAELSQLNVYGLEINTETDIAREDYIEPTIFFDEEKPERSLLHRVLKDKAPHYRIIHVDYMLANIQRSFSFDGNSIHEAFQQIAEEIGCLFVYNSNSDEHGNIQRTISVYDLETYCLDCGHRGEFSDSCPNCNGTNLSAGYGTDTTIFVTSDELAEDIRLTSDTDSTKNCFKLVAGDDLMTATVRNCNPSGTDYIWYFPESQKADMSAELVGKLSAYDYDYRYYQYEHETTLNSETLSKYNALVEKYLTYNSSLTSLSSPIIGYAALMSAYYDTIDFELFLKSTLMPNVEMSDTTAQLQADSLTVENLSPVAVTDVSTISLATADSSVLSMAKAIIDPRYQVKINASSLTSQTWTGSFVVTNYSDEEDVATSAEISITLNDDYEAYVKQKIEKMLKKSVSNSTDITGLFDLEYDDFCVELTKYCLDSLVGFGDCCQSCLDILIEQGVADDDAWADSTPNLYETLYLPYYNKLKAIQAEIAVRENEIAIISGKYDSEGMLQSYGIQNYIIGSKNHIQNILNLSNYLGETLWLELCAYRREDKYENSNYISDGLNNTELFARAQEFIQVAQKEIYKSGELQHSISASLKNLLVMKKFSSLVNYFEVGNWIRVQVDEQVYRLRLLEYEIDYDNLSNLSVVFSDVTKVSDGVSDVESVLAQAQSMGSSYGYTQKQASQGAKGNAIVEDWVGNGLNATNTKIVGSDNQNITWDSHGMLFRQYNPITDSYDPCQLKIINSTLAVTEDEWKTSGVAVGRFTYHDPRDGKYKEAYGVIARTIVGDIILSKNVGIFNENNSISMDENGLVITANGDDSTSDSVFTIQRKSTVDGEEVIEKLLYVNENGRLVLNGSIKISTGNSDDEDSLDYKIEHAGGSSIIGGRNFIKDSDIEWTTTKDSPSYITTMYLVDGLDLQQLVGTKLSLSLYVNAPGNSQVSDSGEETTSNRYGVHGTAKWSDSTGKNTSDKTTYPLTLLSNVGVKNKRVSISEILNPPDGYDTLSSFTIAVQQTLKPASDNNTTWVMGYPQLEIGQATDWNPAPEDMEKEMQTISNQLASLEVTTDGIYSNVQEHTTTISGLEQRTTSLETTVEQMPEGLRIEVSKQIETSLEGYDELRENVSTHFEFGTDGLTIGKTGSIYKQKLSDDKWAITANEEEKIYIDGETGQLYIPEVEITERLAFLNYAWVEDNLGNVNLEYVGGDA